MCSSDDFCYKISFPSKKKEALYIVDIGIQYSRT